VVGPGRDRRFVIRLENDDAGSLRLDDIRAHFSGLDAHVRVSVAALDRLLDERHAALVERALGVLRANSWRTETEVSFSRWGERGSIDILAGHDAARALLVGEVKSEWGSMEETNRRLDVKVRLAPDISVERFGWAPHTVARVLVLPDVMTARRIAAAHALTIDSAYPARGREVRAWIRRPSGPLRGLWFLSEVRPAALGSPG
jgi:hypothetical protein